MSQRTTKTMAWNGVLRNQSKTFRRLPVPNAPWNEDLVRLKRLLEIGVGVVGEGGRPNLKRVRERRRVEIAQMVNRRANPDQNRAVRARFRHQSADERS